MIFRDLLLPVLRLAASNSVSYPGGARVRTVICHKLVDTLYMISLRIGFEMTREHMTFILQKFFAAFNRVYDESFLQSSSSEEAKKQGEQSKLFFAQQLIIVRGCKNHSAVFLWCSICRTLHSLASLMVTARLQHAVLPTHESVTVFHMPFTCRCNCSRCS